MAIRQQAMINVLGKYCRQYFLFKDEPGMDQIKVRLRSDIHRTEQADQEDINSRLLQRLRDNQIGLLNPQYKPYEPVSGWPVLNLDDLVLTAMTDQLDEKVWQAVRSQFEKFEVKKQHENRGGEAFLKDFSTVHQCPTSGFNSIKNHLAESEQRIHSVKAGFDFHGHFVRKCEARTKKDLPVQSTLRKYDATPKFELAKGRVRRDAMMFLETLKDLLEKMLMVKIRHLKSTVPLNLATLGSEKDKESNRIASRLLQYPGGPPLQHNFRDQIIVDAPHSWPSKAAKSSRPMSRLSSAFSNGLTGTRQNSSSAYKERRYTRMRGGTGTQSGPSSGPGSTVKGASRQSITRSGSDSGSVIQEPVNNRHIDTEMQIRFRRHWPPVWMSLAALEQGSYMVDPGCPTRDYIPSLNPQAPKRKKSFTDIMNTRRDWASVRKEVSKATDECLWREDKEKMEFYHVQFSTLNHLPLSKPFPTHQRNIEQLMEAARRRRQKRVIYDCELTAWYKLLVEQVQEEVGAKDEEINSLLETIKMYFKMSATSPRYGKAKLALITMSMPAYVVCTIHVQHALRFILKHVLEAPESLLTGWLASRGLPIVLIKKEMKRSGPRRGAGVWDVESGADV